jgi:hypothetical protein
VAVGHERPLRNVPMWPVPPGITIFMPPPELNAFKTEGRPEIQLRTRRR